MHWFKNLLMYRFTREIELTADSLEKSLSEFEYKPCGSQDFSKFGWKYALGEHGELFTHCCGTNIFISACFEEKVIPSYVVKEGKHNKIVKLEKELGRKLKKTEKDTIQDEVVLDLLPRAFSKKTVINALIMKELGLIVIDASSAKTAEKVLSLLRKSIGSLPVSPVTSTQPLPMTMTKWVREGNIGSGFTIGDNAMFKSIEENGGEVKFKNVDLTSDEAKSHLEANRLVTEISLDWQDRVAFKLDDNFYIKGAKFSDELKDTNDDIDRESVAERFDADLALMSGELSVLFRDIFNLVGGIESKNTSNEKK
ncbi:recombination-associated protein RdgC [Photobacterium kishitanii]|uniref:Recombination-associated protein RdgC n=1 Tax=Photobacterium kishitanii TaxID=318456 RepID=A0A2T3KLT4_9GAMM|nr:recombination-associated protein RdgC [Photobacterium kishitanii]PSV00675.1 recombination-associated protein RdgC [Photobacterium kishitanii]